MIIRKSSPAFLIYNLSVKNLRAKSVRTVTILYASCPVVFSSADPDTGSPGTCCV